MHIHNTTLVCNPNDLPQLLALLREKIIPALTSSGLAHNARLCRICSAIPGQDGSESISLQFEFDSPADFINWKKEHLPAGMDVITDSFGDKVLTFTTLLQHLPHE